MSDRFVDRLVNLAIAANTYIENSRFPWMMALCSIAMVWAIVLFARP